MNDGSIRVGTKLDLSGLKNDIKALEKELKAVQKETDKLNEKEQKVKSQFAGEREIDAMVDKRYRHTDDIDQREANALSQITKQREVLNQKAQEYNAMLEQANAKLQQQNGIQQASKELSAAVKTESVLDKITTEEQYNSLLEQTRAKMASIEELAERIATAHGVSKDAVLASNPTYQKLAETMQVLETTTRQFSSEAEQAGVVAASSMRTASKETGFFGSAMTGAMKKLGKMTMYIFGIRGAYRAVRMALTEYLSTNDELKGQIDTLKSLFGQALGPAIEYVVNLIIKGVAAVNSFVHALTGINVVAKANAAALKKQAKSASGSTASFDEQNKLSGNGSSKVGTLPDGTSYDLSFFDPLMAAIKRFCEDVKPLMNTLKDLGKWLLENVLIPLGDWAANGVLPAFLNILGGAMLTLNSALLALKPIALWFWDNILEPIAKWTGGVIVDVLNGIGNWIHRHHETFGKVVAVVGTIVGVLVGVPKIIGAVGTAIGFLTSPVALIVAAITGLVALFVTLYDECEGFRNGMNRVWDGIKNIFGGAIAWIRAWFQSDTFAMDEAWQRIKDGAANLWYGLIEGLSAGWQWCKEKVSEIWNRIIVKFKEIFGIHSPSTVFASFGEFMMEGLVNGIKGAISKVVNACNQILSAIKQVFSSVGTWFKDTFSNAWKNVRDVFSTGGKIFSGIKEGIASTFKTIVNGLISGINKVIATPFTNINKMLNSIRSISVLGVKPFSNLWKENPLSIPQLPKLAVGGIVNNPGRGVPAIIGEAGPEAVLPLDGPNADAWMDMLADKIGGNVTIPISLDGKRIATYIVDIQKKKAFATNGA